MEKDFDFEEFLTKAVKKGASDIHLHMNESPYIRINGSIIKVNYPELTENDFLAILEKISPLTIKNDILYTQDLDFSYSLPDIARFRVNLNRQLGKIALVMRVIPPQIPTLKDLNILEQAKEFCKFPNGLCFITGSTGSGKSTTLAALLEIINQKYNKHIVTIEEPIEYIFTNKKSIFTQRQVGIDTPSFNDGVKYALRQDPDVIMIGEIRDEQTMTSALKAAETGHLVFATLHTNNAVQTIQRVISLYNPQDREYIKLQLASVLRGIISQKLIKSVDKTYRLPAMEILTITSTAKDLIEKDKLDEIYELNRQGAISNIITLNSQLLKMVEQGLITSDDALLATYNKNELKLLLKGVYYGTRD